jgi:threonine aldolase
MEAVQSNMVFISCKEGQAQNLVESVAKHGVDVLTIGDSIVRAVVHLHITDEDIQNTISAFQNAQ